VYNLRLL